MEGYEENVIYGLNKTIKKNKPIILVEYNLNNFKNIYKYLKKNYYIFSFFLEKKKLVKISKNDIKRLILGKKTENIYTKKQNARCIYYIPKKFKFYNN